MFTFYNLTPTDRHKMSVEIRQQIFKNFEDPDKIRASRFKKIVQEVSDKYNLNMKVVKLSTSWGLQCDCGHSDCIGASMQRTLHIKFEPLFFMKVYI